MVLRISIIIILLFLLNDHVKSESEEKQDPYKVLGVSRSASQETIKKAYKKLARNCFFFDGPTHHTRSNFITSQTYESHVIPTSHEKPFIIEVVSNWCLPCKSMYISSKGSPSLLYHLVAFTNQERLSFGFISTATSDGEILRRKFKAQANVPTVMIFKEEKSVPEVVVMGSELKSGKLREVVEANRFLILPRLSSQKVFNELCPEERFRSQRKLCVVLFTKKGEHEQEKAKLRLLAQQDIFPSERVHFTYIYEDIQTRVATAIRQGLPTTTNNNVTVLK
ncbi:dnaJ homolog subfamily C member 16, partial [Exaiptasia diaphana]|uniref:J domain-containing protein n=1 Tax=Exaiptasia diaphana TaxID=2652724 RepID=A0A913YE70_EXADI